MKRWLLIPAILAGVALLMPRPAEALTVFDLPWRVVEYPEGPQHGEGRWVAQVFVDGRWLWLMPPWSSRSQAAAYAEEFLAEIRRAAREMGWQPQDAISMVLGRLVERPEDWVMK